MRLSRPCYDKYWRCPGWAGGGPKRAKTTRCDNGRIAVDWEDRWRLWKFWPCDTCDVVVLPYRLAQLAPSNLWWWLDWKVSDWWYDRKFKREQRAQGGQR